MYLYTYVVPLMKYGHSHNDHLCEFKRAVQYQLAHREISQLDHRENKVYTLGLSQQSVFIAVFMNTDGFFSYQCIRFIFSMIELRNYSGNVLVCGYAWVIFYCIRQHLAIGRMYPSDMILI